MVNIGSILYRRTKSDLVAYVTSKAALAGLTRALAADLGPQVCVKVFAPAAIATEIVKAGFARGPDLYHGL